MRIVDKMSIIVKIGLYFILFFCLFILLCKLFNFFLILFRCFFVLIFIIFCFLYELFL